MMLARRSPVILVALVGIVFAIVRGKRHPTVSLITCIALVIYFIRIVGFTLLNYYLPNIGHALHLADSQVDSAYTVMFVFEDFVYAVILIILVAAAFIGRRPTDINQLEGTTSNEFA